MASVNKVILVGNLGADPEKRFLGSGKPVCNLRLATSERWNDAQGNKQERTEWHRVVVYGPQADNCEKYLSKGRQVYIEGSIRTNKWKDQQGNDRYTTEIIAQRIQFLGGSAGAGGGTMAGAGGGERRVAANATESDPFPAEEFVPDNQSGGEDDIPF